MSSTRQSILQALRDIRLIDPHSHINPHSPASTTLADILGYHYYTELVHSAGTPKHRIEASGLGPRELVERLVPGLRHLTNTAQHAWLIDICQRFFGFEGDVVDESNWEDLYDAAESTMRLADWSEVVLEKSNVEAVFLTNDFDDSLTGFDTKTYIPCLRTDDLVFHLSRVEVRDRLAVCTGIDLEGSLKSVRDSLEQRFEHFVSHGARACAISLPPDFTPTPVSDGRAATALDAILRLGPSADASHKAAMARRVFWTIVELCDQFRLPMDLMIGVNRGVYAEGVHQGRDLYDSRVSLIQYRELFNAFPAVKFPISVLASVTNQELVSYAWIFPNVLTNGHWWYSNTPSFIRRDAASRLEAVPRNKQIGYYSDAYKLEFIAPKFEMYRNILSGILMDDFVVARGWSEEKAIELGRQILRGNVDTVFPDRTADREMPVPGFGEGSELQADEPSSISLPAIASASLAAAAATDTWQDDESDEPAPATQEGSYELDEVEEITDEELIDLSDDHVTEFESPIADSLDSNVARNDAYDVDRLAETVDLNEAEVDLNATIEATDAPWLTFERSADSSPDQSVSELDLPALDLPEQDTPAADDLPVAADAELWEPATELSEQNDAPSDPHATLELDSSWLTEEPDHSTQETPADESSLNEAPSWDLLGQDAASLDLDSTPIDETLEFDSGESTDELSMDAEASDNEIRYFRADETVEPDTDESSNDELILGDDSMEGMFADPMTGELTMPLPTNDADDILDETYLLPDESEIVEPESAELEFESNPDADNVELRPADDEFAFDDLELEPLSDEGDDLVAYADEATGEVDAEPSQASTSTDATIKFDDDIDFTFDEPRTEDPKP